MLDGSKTIDSVQVNTSALLRLASRKEKNTGDSGRNSSRKCSDCVERDFLRTGLLTGLSALHDHVRLENHTFEENVLFV